MEEIEGLEKLTNLTELDLCGNDLTSITGLETLTNLTWLDLNENQLTAITGLETLTNLTQLYLFNNRLTAITGLETRTNLTQLYLDNNQITAITGLETLTNLTQLYLDNNQIPSTVVAEIASLPGDSFGQQCVQYCRSKSVIKKLKQLLEISDQVALSDIEQMFHLSRPEVLNLILAIQESVPDLRIKNNNIIVEKEKI